MGGGNKKPQLRRCTNCNKVGHNRSRCPDLILNKTVKDKPTSTTTIRQPAPVKFFIHHVGYEYHNSPHVVDLKKPSHDVWKNVETVEPQKSTKPAYHFYHLEETQPVSPPPAPAPIVPVEIFQEKKGDKEDKIQILPISIPTTPKPTTPKIKLRKRISERWDIIRDNLAETSKNFLGGLKAAFPKKRLITAGILFLGVIIIPTQAHTYYRNVKSTTDKIANASTEGFSNLQESTTALLANQIPEAQTSLVTALGNFESAVSEMQSKHQLLQKIATAVPIINSEVRSRQKLITAGQKIALGNTYVLKGLGDSKENPNLSLTDRLSIITAHLQAATPNYEQALADFNDVDINSLPLDYQEDFRDFKTLFASLTTDLKNISELGTSLQEIFGGQGLRRYLLIFQNPNEIRPTGGFMGSFAVMDVKDGKIVKIDIPAGGTYDLQGQLDKFVEPPSPLLLSNKRWEFQDANWFPDFPASAEKMLWFYRHARNLTADGVITINASVLERLLAIVGPVTDEKRNLTLSADNALTTIQEVVESGPEKQDKKPKQIIADLAPKFVSYFENIKPENLMPVMANLQEALEQKEIQAYFTDPKAENSIKSMGWSGQVLSVNPDQDYIFVVNTNIQGQKSDARINQTISHQAVVDENGSIMDTVVITREHTGSKEEPMYGQTNIDYLRLYVPQGSELVSASGFTWPNEGAFKAPESWYEKDEDLTKNEKQIGFDTQSGTKITQEFGKTSFGNWIITEPGETSRVQFTYRLPFKITMDEKQGSASHWLNTFISNEDKVAHYQLVAQHQSGSLTSFESQIIFPDNWTPTWQDGNLKLAANGAVLEKTSLEKDTVWSLIMQKISKN